MFIAVSTEQIGVAVRLKFSSNLDRGTGILIEA
jgi:hypothetical protein